MPELAINMGWIFWIEKNKIFAFYLNENPKHINLLLKNFYEIYKKNLTNLK